jgi:flagellar hook-associated protein 1 FlgK
MTGHNITNASTPGYSRQVAEFTTRPGQSYGNGYIGGGTQITTIKRVFDEFLSEQLRTSTTGQARFSMLETLASRVDNVLADPDTGLNTGLQDFFNAVQDLSNDPASIPARRAALEQAASVAQRFRSLDGQLATMDGEVNDRIGESVAAINRLAGAIAAVNEDIVAAKSATGQPPNDLLDQRDLLVRQLSEQVGVSTALQDDGSLNVFIGSGQTLVVGSDARQLGIAGGEFDATRTEIVYPLGSATATTGATITSSLSGGALGGLLEFRAQILQPTRQALGETALALTMRFNEQHAAGMDLKGQLGADFFGVAPPAVFHSGNNGGSGTVSVAIGDITALDGADYILEFDGTGYTLELRETGQAVPMSGSGTAADPFVAAGLEFTVGGTPAAGDRVLIRPANAAAGSMTALVTDPQAIAMASPVRTRSAIDNIGNATIGAPEIVDASDPDLLATTVIEFTSTGTYSINGAGSFAYADGGEISVNGVTFTISGAPAAGDRYTLEPNLGGSGDNSNGLLLGEVQSVGILDGGTVSINDHYGQLVAAVGGATQQIKSNLEAQNVLLANAEDAQLSQSGVNLDEEAANLVRFQQAYQAAAHVVSVASTLFESLLNATRR